MAEAFSVVVPRTRRTARQSAGSRSAYSKFKPRVPELATPKQRVSRGRRPGECVSRGGGMAEHRLNLFCGPPSLERPANFIAEVWQLCSSPPEDGSRMFCRVTLSRRDPCRGRAPDEGVPDHSFRETSSLLPRDDLRIERDRSLRRH